MATLVVVLRAVSLLCFAAPMLLGPGARPERSGTEGRQRAAGRTPVAANFAAFAVFIFSLWMFSGSRDGPPALWLASLGSLLASAGAALILRSRAALGSAWSFVPVAHQATGLITTGPYRLVRHPIYLGLALLAMGNAVAFFNGPAAAVVLCGIVPTFAWRARTEERVLSRTFGERHVRYQEQTRMIIPWLF
jgi:protein-S-isoprenylcysteine O-methyltransferase Ste14